MNITAESVLTILKDLDMPVTLEEIKYPTEAFMINILTEFLDRFSIDVTSIKKLDYKQIEALRLIGEQNIPIICSIFNLREAIVNISKEIFIKDFSVNDITNPGPKRTRKNLKMIANFILYSRSVLEKTQPKLDEVLARGQQIEDLRKKVQIILETINTKACDIAQKKTMIDCLVAKEIVEAKQKLQLQKERKANVELEITKMREKKRHILEKVQDKRGDVSKMKEITKQLHDKIVNHPESYTSRLEELSIQIKNKKQKREALQDALRSKKPMIETLENISSLVLKSHTKFPEIVELNNNILDMTRKTDVLKGQINEITQFDANIDAADDEKVITKEIDKCKIAFEELVARNHATIKQFRQENKSLETNLSEKHAENSKLSSECDKIRSKKIEEELKMAKFLQEAQILMNRDISNMLALHKNAHEEVATLLNGIDDIGTTHTCNSDES